MLQAPVDLVRQSPHCDQRPDGECISLLVIHNISLPPGQFVPAGEEKRHIDDFFLGQLDVSAHPFFADIAHLRVSAHCVIWRDGQIWQYVPFDRRAWHAGVSCFAGQEQCNDFSIGIELEGTDDLPYTDAQYQSLTRLTHWLMQQYPAITPERITGHQHIAPTRKTDPGPAFDWQRYRTALQESTL
ncbi:1,6-anhydro-N-acetylmuramyl-L-alanine amidase AmpD [Alkalimonas amylolytica]|uniref:1,6-anhydro-N-acetylmuramyl-L-alanine amidase AmpD n=1 Tax=Alkalimonas amylolytica TaxID=152573 RepID=A0A1H4E6W9_ALKAM|nr:1,6-anhydro-N-acetylmuramyl-L-alanine amidase AmpD [Alkalimonas amylolytica]SEA80478.1 AmpD protein [Alkalimonas amylolytica]